MMLMFVCLTFYAVATFSPRDHADVERMRVHMNEGSKAERMHVVVGYDGWISDEKTVTEDDVGDIFGYQKQKAGIVIRRTKDAKLDHLLAEARHESVQLPATTAAAVPLPGTSLSPAVLGGTALPIAVSTLPANAMSGAPTDPETAYIESIE